MIPNVTLGADPEIIFQKFQTGEIVNAVTVIQEFLGRGKKSGKFGVDGHEPICELRPAPKNTPREMVEEIRSIMIQGYQLNPDVRNLKWTAGTYPSNKPIGGHIHLGNVYDTGTKVRKLFDGLLGVITLLMEVPDEAPKRHNSVFNGYGEYGHLCIDDKDHRSRYAQLKKAKAGHGIEYKSLSSWMVSPGISLGILAIAKAIGVAIVNGDLDHFTKNDWQLLEVDRDAFYACKKEKFIPKIDALFDLMFKRFSYFKTSPERLMEVKSLLRKDGKEFAEIQRELEGYKKNTLPVILKMMVDSKVLERDPATHKYYQSEFFDKINDTLPLRSFSGMAYWKNVIFLKQVIKDFKVWENNVDIKKRWDIINEAECKEYMSITSQEFLTDVCGIQKNTSRDSAEPSMESPTFSSGTTIRWESME